jgi:hypothetical protein
VNRVCDWERALSGARFFAPFPVRSGGDAERARRYNVIVRRPNAHRGVSVMKRSGKQFVLAVGLALLGKTMENANRSTSALNEPPYASFDNGPIGDFETPRELRALRMERVNVAGEAASDVVG